MGKALECSLTCLPVKGAQQCRPSCQPGARSSGVQTSLLASKSSFSVLLTPLPLPLIKYFDGLVEPLKHLAKASETSKQCSPPRHPHSKKTQAVLPCESFFGFYAALMLGKLCHYKHRSAFAGTGLLTVQKRQSIQTKHKSMKRKKNTSRTKYIQLSKIHPEHTTLLIISYLCVHKESLNRVHNMR